jgi:hypothetical protein
MNMIWTFENKVDFIFFKIHILFQVKLFLTIFLHICHFGLIYHMLNPYKIT